MPISSFVSFPARPDLVCTYCLYTICTFRIQGFFRSSFSLHSTFPFSLPACPILSIHHLLLSSIREYLLHASCVPVSKMGTKHTEGFMNTYLPLFYPGNLGIWASYWQLKLAEFKLEKF